MRFLPLHLTKTTLLTALPHWFGIALKLFSSVTVCSHKFHIPLVCCICVQGKPLVAPPRRLLPSTHRAGLRRPAAAFPPIPPFPLPEAGRCGERPASFGAEPLSDCALCAQERRGTCGLAEVLPPLGNRSRGSRVKCGFPPVESKDRRVPSAASLPPSCVQEPRATCRSTATRRSNHVFFRLVGTGLQSRYGFASIVPPVMVCS